MVRAGDDALRKMVEDRFDLSIVTATEFFAANADSISAASLSIAQRFERGGRLLVFGEGADATDAQHVSVEFIHPVIVGKRALPAIALTNDVATLTDSRKVHQTSGAFTSMLESLGRVDDVALFIGVSAPGHGQSDVLARAAALGMLTIAIERDGVSPTRASADQTFRVPGADPFVAQEVAETLYHVFWELVHLFLEHGCGDGRVPECIPDEDGKCSICADEAIPGVVLSLNSKDATAQVQLPTEVATIAIDLLDETTVGDSVMVHMGFAISRVEAAAR